MKRIVLSCISLVLVCHSFDTRAQWQGPMQGSPQNVQAVCFIDSLTGFVSPGISTYGASRTTDGGASWLGMELPGQPAFSRFRFRDRNLGLAVGANGVIFKTTDAGATWTSRASGTTDALRDVAFAPGGGVWACGDNVIVHSTDNGESWTANSALPGFGALWSISFRTAQDGWTVGLYARVLHTTDGGTTWSSWQSPSLTSHFGIRWLTSTRGVMITPWPIMVSTDAGATWLTRFDSQGSSVYDLDFADSLNGWVVGQSGVILHSTDGGDSWALQASPVANVSYIAVSCISPRLSWAGGYGGLFTTVNGGDVPAAVAGQPEVPGTFALEQNYPNPFNPSTSVKYTVGGVRDQGPGASKIRLVVYDLLGREVAVLVDERMTPGSYEVSFDASGLASGVYIYRLSDGSFVQSRKMVLLR